jgi:hypothetical protein
MPQPIDVNGDGGMPVAERPRMTSIQQARPLFYQNLIGTIGLPPEIAGAMGLLEPPLDALVAAQVADVHAKLSDLDTKLAKAGVPAGQRKDIDDRLWALAATPDFGQGLKEVEDALAAKDPKGAVRDLVMRWRIDGYLDRSNHAYEIDGQTVRSHAAFRITSGVNGDPETIKKKLAKVTGRKDKAFRKAAHRAAYGRASPEEIELLTKALIAKGLMKDVEAKFPNMTKSQQVEKLQWEHGVGVDCAGYVQQAFLDVHGGRRSDYGFDSLGNENLYDLRGNRKFAKVDPEHARSGDLLILKPPKHERAGHTVLIRDRREWSAAEKAAASDPQGFAGKSDVVHVFEVDASFGAGVTGDVDKGGVQRRTWLYNETTKKWADMNNGVVVPSTQTGPYEHPMQGIYHPKKSAR